MKPLSLLEGSTTFFKRTQNSESEYSTSISPKLVLPIYIPEVKVLNSKKLLKISELEKAGNSLSIEQKESSKSVNSWLNRRKSKRIDNNFQENRELIKTLEDSKENSLDLNKKERISMKTIKLNEIESHNTDNNTFEKNSKYNKKRFKIIPKIKKELVEEAFEKKFTLPTIKRSRSPVVVAEETKLKAYALRKRLLYSVTPIPRKFFY